MDPALSRGMHLDDAEFRQLIPILHPHTRMQDLDTLRAWYEAVADVLRMELTADLLALWLFDADGAPMLLEPEALAADHLEIPPADPLINQTALQLIEDRIRRAGYGSVMFQPIRHGGQDVGLILLATFPPYAYGVRAEQLMAVAADTMAPMLARVTRGDDSSARRSAGHLVEESVEPAAEPRRLESDLLASLADAVGGAGTPRDLMLALSFSLQHALPHDAYELLIPDTAGEQFYRLGLHGHGALWADPSLVRPRDALDPSRLFGDDARVLLDDAEQVPGLALPVLVTVRGAEVPPRSLIGVQLRVVERVTGYLLLGAAGPELYREEDLVLLDRIGALLAPRIESLVLAWQYSVLRSQFDLLRHVPMHLARVAELLATTPFLGEGSRIFVQQAGALLPLGALEFAIRLSDEQRIAVVRPGVTTPLADLPQEPIDDTGVAQVVRGEIPYLLETDHEESGPVSVLVVPLRSGGKVFGAMALTVAGEGAFSRTDMALAQQLADLAAPHLDLARRGAPMVIPYIPGWKRPSYRTEREAE